MPDTNLIALAAKQVAPFATLDLNTVMNGIVLASVVSGIHRLGKIRDHLAALNNRIGKVETWKDDHLTAEKQDAENHVATREQCQALHAERLRSVHAQVDVLFRRIGDRWQGDRPAD
jgi:hypothetical protein